MYQKPLLFCFLLLLASAAAPAQRAFTEGTVVYKVRLESPEHAAFNGKYTYTIKGNLIRKELKLNNGYQDVVILNCDNNSVYSLQNHDGKKYAIELNMADIRKNQEQFGGFSLIDESSYNRKIAGMPVYKSSIKYKNGTFSDIYYIKEWQPAQSVTFERFPDCKFFPMLFSYKDDSNMIMEFETEKIEPGPIDNGVFRVPAEYKIITNAEYKQLSK